MHVFGKLTFRPKTFEIIDATGQPLEVTVMALFDENGVEWHELFTTYPHPWYIAVMDDGIIISMESDPEQSQIADITLIGIDTDYGYTRGNGGTVYGKYWDGSAIIPKPMTPEEVVLTAEQFYTMLDGLGVLEEFMNQIETVTPLSLKLTCRNQFNNSSNFTFDMTLLVTVAPKVWPTDWQATVGPAWLAAGGY